MAGSSKIENRDKSPGVRGLPSLDRGILRLCGVFEWGPIEIATPVIDFEHFRSIFGPGKGYLASYESAVQLKQWFLGKGRKAIICRVTKKNSGTTTATKATATAQTGATAATKGSVTSTNAAPYALVTGDTLVGNVDTTP